MDDFLSYLSQFGHLNSSQRELIVSHVRRIFLGKESYFSEAGKVSRQVAFVQEGILRVLFYNKDGLEVTRYFIDEHHWAVDLNSYNLQIPSSEYIQAVTDCELLTFTREALELLSAEVDPWSGIMAKITNQALLEKVNRISPMISEDATTRYTQFLERYPSLANRIPLNHLASYIGITKSSLSRIRSSLRY